MTNLAEIKKLRCEFAGLRTQSDLTGELLKALASTFVRTSELFRKNSADNTGRPAAKRQVYSEGRWRNLEDLAFHSSSS